MRNVLLWLHIVSAILIIGGLAFMSMMLPGLVRGGQENLPVLRRLNQTGRVFGPASMIVLLLGVALGIKGDFDFSEPWLSLSFVIFIATGVLGGPVGGRALGMAIGRIERGESADGQASRLSIVGGVNILLLLGIVWLMVAKPGLG